MTNVTNADPAFCETDGLHFRWTGHRYGCGHCGAVAEDDFPDCCPTMAEWKRRFAAVIAGPHPPPEPEPHDILRWRRVAERWGAKHRH